MVFLVDRDYQVKSEHHLALSMVRDLSMVRALSTEVLDLSMVVLDLSTEHRFQSMEVLDLYTEDQFMDQVCDLKVKLSADRPLISGQARSQHGSNHSSFSPGQGEEGESWGGHYRSRPSQPSHHTYHDRGSVSLTINHSWIVFSHPT